MKKNRWFIFVILCLFCIGLFFTLTAALAKESPARTGTGRVTAIEEGSIVVEIPAGKDFMTVGAIVPPDAKILKKGKKVKLADIKVGDKVTIKWVVYENGHKAKEIRIR